MSYRKIYEVHFGPIPVDEDGRSYDIHHIDRNRKNNDPSNLIALSLEAHYKLHYDAGEFRAANAIALRMKITPSDASRLASMAAHERVRSGKHHFIGGEVQAKTSRKRVADGSHHFQTKAHSERVREKNTRDLEAGRHNFTSYQVRCKVDEANSRRLADGSHPFRQGVGVEATKRRIANGLHHFQDKDRQRELSLRAKLKNSIRISRISPDGFETRYESISAAVADNPGFSRKKIDAALLLGVLYMGYFWKKNTDG